MRTIFDSQARRDGNGKLGISQIFQRGTKLNKEKFKVLQLCKNSNLRNFTSVE